MKKRKWVIFTALILVLGVMTGVAGAKLISEIKAELRRDFEVMIDGEVKDFKNVNGERVYPILYEGTTYLPLRAIGELMNKRVYWYEADKRIELKGEAYTVTDADVIIPSEDEKPNNNNQSVDKSKFISEKEALKIALKHAGLSENDVKVIENRLDLDDGVWQYEIDFRQALKEYDYEIKADDGKIIDFDVDID